MSADGWAVFLIAVAGLALVAVDALSWVSEGGGREGQGSAFGASAAEKAFWVARDRRARLATGLAVVAVACGVAGVIITLIR